MPAFPFRCSMQLSLHFERNRKRVHTIGHKRCPVFKKYVEIGKKLRNIYEAQAG